MSCPWARIERQNTVNLEEVMNEEVKKLSNPLQKPIHEHNGALKSPFRSVDILSDTPGANSNKITFGMSQPQNKEFNDLSEVEEEEEDMIEIRNTEDWDKFDNLEHEFASVPQKGYKINRHEKIMTKYDVVLTGRNIANHPECPIGNKKFDVELSNKLLKSLNINLKNKKEVYNVGGEQKHLETSEFGGLDQYTCHILSDMICNQLIQRINGVVCIGKEAVILKAELHPSYPFIRDLAKECVIKIFKRKTLDEFKQHDQFIKYCHKLKEEQGKGFAAWSGKEMSNLKKLARAGVRCPKVISLRAHVLVMSFIGKGNHPAPPLRDAITVDADSIIAYNEVIDALKAMYQKANLIHGDLSENNILWHDGHCYFIDFSQSVGRSHQHAMYLLSRDCCRITDFFTKYGVPEVLSSDELFTFVTGFIELHERKIELAQYLLSDPEKSLEEWDKAAISAQLTLSRQANRKTELKIKAHCRIHYLAHLARHSIFPGNKDAGKFLQISGTVMRMTASKLLEYQRQYVCMKCKTPTIVKACYDRKYMIKQPKHCSNPEGCSGTNLVHFGELDSDNCKDYQEIKIQEQVKRLGIGSIPNTIWVTLEDDLVDSCQPGDDVTICGIVRRQFGEFVLGKRTEINLVFKANHVQVDTNSSLSMSTLEISDMFSSFWEKYAENPLEGRDVILKSFCPQIYGLYPVKLAISVILAGGCPIEDVTSTGVRIRPESHLLLVGDPGTGKSQLLKFAAKIIPRAVLTTGVGSTSAGLTVTATMEHGEWHLEAGALVMADGGICCIDEFNSMKEHDRTTIHEAMEQQTISVAKASMVCKLNTRCSILAACNPKGNVDPTQSLQINTVLPSPLLSRFDLIMLLRDTVDPEWDEKVIDYILNGGNNLSKLTDSGLWSVNNLQSYFKLIKKFQPKLTEDAELILSTYYNIQRRMGSRNKARTTVRLLESLIRLSQGHARLMYHEKVLVVDSIYAVFLVDVAMDHESSILNLNICTNSVFPENPMSQYRNLVELILNKLQLFEILDREVNNLKVPGTGPLQSRFFANQMENDNVNSNIEEDAGRNEIDLNTKRDEEKLNNDGSCNNVQAQDIKKKSQITSEKCDILQSPKKSQHDLQENMKNQRIFSDSEVTTDDTDKNTSQANPTHRFQSNDIVTDTGMIINQNEKNVCQNSPTNILLPGCDQIEEPKDPVKPSTSNNTCDNSSSKSITKSRNNRKNQQKVHESNILDLIPSVNDGFHLDLDMNWED